MAITFPAELPEHIRRDPLRSAECRVFDALKAQLSREFRVFYSSPWLGTTPEGEERDGEADFTVAHPELGLLVLEVKGGRIEVTSGDRQWISTDRVGFRHRIKNPVGQARSGKHELLKKLKERAEWRSRYIRARHGVVLPDIASAAPILGADSPPEIFACAPEMRTLGDWVTGRLSASDEEDADKRVEPLGLDGLNALEILLARGFTLKIDLRTYLDQDVARIDALSEQQYWVIESLWDNARLTVAGPAGSGKTIVAAHLAELSSQVRRLRTLLVCLNAPLAAFLRDRLGHLERLDVASYADFCRMTCDAAGVRPPDGLENLHRACMDAMSTPDRPAYDQIIVDEGQDFEDEWLEALEFALDEDGPGRLSVFYDSNQRVRGRGRRYIEDMPATRFPLTRNFRNTRRIFDVGQRFYEGTEVRPLGPEGVDVEWHAASGGPESEKRLREVVGGLVTASGIPADRIVILCADMGKRDVVLSGGMPGRVPTTTATHRTPGKVVVDSVRRFKGLESDVVIVFRPELYINDPELLYVAATRARALLHVIGDPEALAILKGASI